MNSIKDLEKQASEMQAKLDEMHNTIKQMKETKEKTLWKPKESEPFYYLSGSGVVGCTYYSQHSWTRNAISVGNYYKSEKLAEVALKQSRAMQRLRELANGYTFNRDSEDGNYCLTYDHDTEKWETMKWYSYQSVGDVYFASEEEALAAIKELGSDLNVLLETTKED